MKDLISRQAAIDAIAKMMPQSLTPDGSHPADEEIFIAQEAFADCIKTIEILPSAQPERIKGHWIDAVIPNDSGGLPVIVCDKCNTFFPLQFGASHNFCPNCGADMRGEQDDESRSNSNAQTDTRARGMGATDKSSGI